MIDCAFQLGLIAPIKPSWKRMRTNKNIFFQVKNMSSPWIMYVYLLVVVPLLFYVGISILVKQQEFRLFPVFSILILSIVLVMHASTIVRFIRSMMVGEPIPIHKPLGIFTIVLAVLLLCLHLYLLYHYYAPPT
jgi:hypothetical protein